MSKNPINISELNVYWWVVEVHNKIKNYLTLRSKMARSFLVLYSKRVNFIDTCSKNGPIFLMYPESYRDDRIPAILLHTPKEAILVSSSKIWQTFGLVHFITNTLLSRVSIFTYFFGPFYLGTGPYEPTDQKRTDYNSIKPYPDELPHSDHYFDMPLDIQGSYPKY